MHRRALPGWVVGGAAALAACTAPEALPPAPTKPPLWPPLPEQPRFVYEATLRNAGSLLAASERGRMQSLLTGDEAMRETFGKPMGVAAAAGRIYVTDTEARRIFVFDLPRRRTFSFGLRREGRVKKPSGIAVDRLGRVYVVDTSDRRIVLYDALGLYEGEIDGSAAWVRPTAVAASADGARVHVLDTGGVESDSHRVFVHDRSGTLLHTIGKRGEAAGEFNLPSDLAIAPDGRLWVLDAGNFRVQAFDTDGRAVMQFGSAGSGLGQLARPRGLAVDRDGLVYVADALLCNVQVFQADGQLLLAIGARAQRDAPGRYLLPARLACDETGRLYVVDQYLHKVEVIRRLTDAEGLALQRQG